MTTHISGSTGVSKVQDGVIVQADLGPNVVGNGPAFSAYQSTFQSINSTASKINLQSEEFDVGSCFNTTLSRFQPNIAGYYWLYGQLSASMSGSPYSSTQLRKNGVIIASGLVSAAAGNFIGLPVSKLVYLNGTTDYVEMFGVTNNASNTTVGLGNTFFQGFLVRAA